MRVPILFYFCTLFQATHWRRCTVLWVPPIRQTGGHIALENKQYQLEATASKGYSNILITQHYTVQSVKCSRNLLFLMGEYSISSLTEKHTSFFEPLLDMI